VKIGEIELTPIVDAEGTFATVGEVFPAIADTAQWWVPVQVVLIRSPDAIILVDAGLGPAPRAFVPDAEAHLLDELAPDEVDVVVHTHLHVDHVGWDGAFPRARYIVHGDDLAFFLTPESLEDRPHLREKVLPLRERGLIDAADGEVDVAEGVRVVPTPGHTPGHVCVHVESRGERAVVLGDVVVHELQVADPDVVYVSDHDAVLAAETRRRVLGELADAGVPVMVSHFKGAGRFERRGKGFWWEAAV
jgi:glyoxylase-like metal-dependent hydrolase (beta-lactamase superfamily II)